MKKKFWNWVRNEDTGARTLVLNGQISDETWYGDEVTPGLFREELNAGEGDITVWINSPGGDVFAAAQIYNMLKEYPGNVEVRIDGMAASAASVVAMAGDKVSMSPVAMMMIHNPMTVAMGDKKVMQQAIDMLQRIDEHIGIGNRWNDDRHATSTPNRLVITLVELTSQFAIVARQTNHGFPVGFRKRTIGCRKIRLPVKAIIHRLLFV